VIQQPKEWFMKRILIIEDDRKLALALCVRLKANGYSTWIASDGIEGLSAAYRERPDLILLDLSLPAGHGLALARELRQHSETARTPIILATASKDPNLRATAMELGAAGVIGKPYDAKTLLVMVQGALGDTSLSTLRALTARANPASAPAPALPKRVTKTILVVEDDERLALAISLRMKAAGFETAVAVDAPSAVRCATQIEPDAVVLDISLPGGDGFLVAERIQAHTHKPTAIVFLTASKLPGLRERAKELGAAGFLEKPYKPEVLLDLISQAVLREAIGPQRAFG
jgi:DNA-binding response OmpR family regulator